MKKDRSILNLLDVLEREIDFVQVLVTDYWEADLCSIGLKRNNKLVYICTYPYLKENPLRYDYDLDIEDEVQFKTMKSARGASEENLIMEVKMFLEI